MQSQNKISFPCRKVLVIGFLFCSIISFNALGQEERGTAIVDNPAEYDHITVVDGSGHSDLENKSPERVTTRKLSQESENNEQAYKQGGEKDVKKEGMSTLSFNLFLYVVDKFKEDN